MSVVSGSHGAEVSLFECSVSELKMLTQSRTADFAG